MSDVKRHFHTELDGLQNRLMEMAGLVESLLEFALDAYLSRRAGVAVAAKDRDRVIDAVEKEIDGRAVELLALQQPMAVDLRQIFTTLKISNDLERIGDNAVNIAQASERLSALGPLPVVPEVREMAAVAREMLAGAFRAYSHRDVDAALAVCRMDDRADDLRSRVADILLKRGETEGHQLRALMESLLVSQKLERVADLATNIAEDVVFLVEGRNIKHDPAALVLDGEEMP